jgi:L-alanine-DL-glutamate epimerase-like enolase superfamily enzyme
MTAPAAIVDGLVTRVYRVPAGGCEADGTLSWADTTVVVVEARSGTTVGLGWTYAGGGAAAVVMENLAGIVTGGDAMAPPMQHEAMARAVRNLGRPGLVACALSAVDTALWDLKARLLDLSLADLFGPLTEAVAVYGSGGFTTYDEGQTEAQLRQWTEQWQIPRVKMKIGESWGTRPDRDLQRVAFARRVVGDQVELFVDANGGYQRKQAVRLGARMAEQYGVTWFEEPVSSDDLDGLRMVRDLCPADIAAGEYGYSPTYFAPMVKLGAVDCLQVDVTRCGGYTDWLIVAHLAAASGLEVSAHCAPNLHAHVAVAVPNARHLEYFHDHHRIEHLLFDGALDPTGGTLRPDRTRPGHGMSIRGSAADMYRCA